MLMPAKAKRIVDTDFAWVIQCLRDEYSHLTDWEKEFVFDGGRSITKAYAIYGDLTEKQYNKLQEVYRNAMNRTNTNTRRY